MQVDIRPAGPTDADLVSELNREVQSKHVSALPWLFKDHELSHDAAKALLEAVENLVLLAFIDSEPAGYIYAEFRDLPETALRYAYRTAHIHHISVEKKFRRSGVGHALMERIISAAKSRNIDRLTTDFWAFNDESRAFFESFGLFPYMLRMWKELPDRS